jgi:RimJ/RimL family protein N-acetyltransferase
MTVLLNLVPRTRDEVRANIEAMDPESRAQVSADWWAKFERSAFQDPWVHGFSLLLADGTNVGIGSFKGPPVNGVVEIAYAVLPEHQRQGYATAAARAMVEYAFKSPQVRLVIAHTLPDGVASQRVLLKAGFRHTGEVVDPDDGLVWRFEVAPYSRP